MANMEIKDGAAAQKYLKASGAGTALDPYVPEHAVTGTVAVSTVTAVTSITNAVGVTDNSGSLTVDDGGTTLSIDDGAGSLTVDIASAAWTQFYAAYTASDTSEVTTIAAPGTGYKLQFRLLAVVSGAAAANVLIIKNGATSIRAVPTQNPMDGYVEAGTYPDYLTFAENAALAVSHSANNTWWCYGSYRVVAA